MKKSMSSFMDAVLTRAEMKKIVGGTTCSLGPCSLVIQNSSGQWVSNSGNCSIAGLPFDFRCYCNLGDGVEHPIKGGGPSNCQTG